MARPYRLRDIEQEYGESLDTLIPRLLKELGTVEAVASRLNVASKTVFLWLQHNGFERQVTIRWRKTKKARSSDKAALAC